jgi:hypothetical protein
VQDPEQIVESARATTPAVDVREPDVVSGR